MHEPARRTVLIADDHPLFRAALRRALEEAVGAAEVIEAADVESLRAAAARAPDTDLVLLDLMMPGIDGIEVCRGLKADKNSRHIRVIAMTGYPSDANQSAMIGVGAETCLSKPIDHERLLDAIGSPLLRAAPAG